MLWLATAGQYRLRLVVGGLWLAVVALVLGLAVGKAVGALACLHRPLAGRGLLWPCFGWLGRAVTGWCLATVGTSRVAASHDGLHGWYEVALKPQM